MLIEAEKRLAYTDVVNVNNTKEIDDNDNDIAAAGDVTIQLQLGRFGAMGSASDS